jgi:dTDP-4-amino-4,6-dideoxygalactose transaminase
MFCLEKHPPPGASGLTDKLGGEDQRFCMSGRCAIYYCLRDLMRRDAKRVAYLPAYTCETVVAPYKKAGYKLLFYDVSPENLAPRFNRELIPRISVLALCGYYGFSFYDREFAALCAAAGVGIIQDITHSVFSADGIEARADYHAGSLRKWMGIPSGGIAIKRRGKFSLPLLPPEETHIRGRLDCFTERERALNREPGASEERAEAIFWETELRLRRIFDVYASDPFSVELIRRYPWEDLFQKRRDNYRYVLSQAPFNSRATPVFPELGEGVCPSHLSLYSPDRDAAQKKLARLGVASTFYWPFHGECSLSDFPGASYVYDHIYSLPVDQRYSREAMAALCAAIGELGNSA